MGQTQGWGGLLILIVCAAALVVLGLVETHSGLKRVEQEQNQPVSQIEVTEWFAASRYPDGALSICRLEFSAACTDGDYRELRCLDSRFDAPYTECIEAWGIPGQTICYPM